MWTTLIFYFYADNLKVPTIVSVVNGGKQQSSTCLPCDSEGEGLRDQTGGVTVFPICGSLFVLDYQRVRMSC